jgi:hypothetical protein
MFMKCAALAFAITVVAGFLAFGNIIPETDPANNVAAIVFTIALIATIGLGGLGVVPRETDRGQPAG